MRRILLSNSTFEGSNNVYLFDDGPETVLVDTGDGEDGTRDELRSRLEEYDVAVEDVDRILLTHWHHDHVGMAAEIQAESGATVHVHACDADLVAGDRDAWAEMRSRMETCFDEWGMPQPKQEALRDRASGMGTADDYPDVEPFEDGDTFSVNGRELTAIHVSGHAAGLCLFEMADGGEREVISGDALLPVYTPNVGGADVRVERPLEKYVEGLRSIDAANYARAWPGHRDMIDRPSERARAIVRHHEERAWRVLDAVRRLGPCDTWTVSHDLFGELDGIHVLHGPGEAYAHLEHLEREGSVVRDGIEYRLADDAAERLSAETAERWPL